MRIAVMEMMKSIKWKSTFFLVVAPLVSVSLYWVAFDYLEIAAPPTRLLSNYLAPPPASPTSFDYFKLALQWPPSVWSRHGQPPLFFTIHGLWPDNKTGSYLQNCVNQPYVTITNPALVQRLNTNWPDLIRGNNVAFWTHEWNKHGTCALLWYTQTTYFTLALDLQTRYNLVQRLQQSGIVPSNTAKYPVQNIRTAVIALTSKIPDLMCFSSKLQEIRICFNPGSPNSVIDCPQHRSSTTCSGSVTFPK